MNYAKAIRIARALADIPQRELAERISIDTSLVSMLESGKRKPSLETLEKIASALGIPFHLFTLLASESKDLSGADPEAAHRLALGLSKLLLGGDEDAGGSRNLGRKARNTKRKSTRRHSPDSKRKTR